MRAFRSPSRRRRAWVLPVVALGVAAVVGTALWRPWAPETTPASVVAAGAGDAAVATSPEPLALPEHPTVLVFGDSWTYGSAASDPSLGYAYVVGELAGWKTIVDGVGGSGYLKPGIDGADFGTRIAALDPALDPDLVIVQGSINDRREGADGYRAAVDAAWDTLARVSARTGRDPGAGAPGAAGRGGDCPHRPRPARRRSGSGLVVHLAARRRLDHR